MRSSMLSAQVEKIDNRKRTLSDDDKQTDNETDVKKNKPSDELSASEAARRERLHLTDELEKPVGIGTFGFMNQTPKNSTDASSTDKPPSSGDSTSSTAPKASTNYFQVKSSPVKFDFKQPAGTASPSGASSSTASTEDKDKAETANGETSRGEEETDTAPTDFTNEAVSEDSKKSILMASASEYQEKKNEKHQLDEIQHMTGEEGENHVLQIMCKLHVFDKDKKSWLERGRGTLKLNDIARSTSSPASSFQSRVVFRSQGANIVQMNTLVWPDMCCEAVTERSLRLSAMDADTNEIRVFLLNGNKANILTVMNAINGRIQALKRSQVQNLSSSISAERGGSSSGGSSSQSSHTSHHEDSKDEGNEEGEEENDEANSNDCDNDDDDDDDEDEEGEEDDMPGNEEDGK